MKTSKSAIFLFELMIIILVFTLAAAICTEIFAQSYTMSTESRELTMSSMSAQAVAEEFKSGAEASEIQTLYFDRDWSPVQADAAYYTVALEEQEGGARLRDALVNVYKHDSPDAIYSLRVKEFTN